MAQFTDTSANLAESPAPWDFPYPIPDNLIFSVTGIPLGQRVRIYSKFSCWSVLL